MPTRGQRVPAPTGDGASGPNAATARSSDFLVS